MKKTRHPTCLKLVFGGGDLSPTVTGIESASFQVGPGGLGGWVGSRVPVDTPSFRSMKVENNDPKESKEQKKNCHFVNEPLLLLEHYRLH